MGVACNDDARRLHTDHGLCVRGCVDLRYIALRCRAVDVGVTGLKGMAEKVLDVTLNKNFHLRCSNWEAEELSSAQVSGGFEAALVHLSRAAKIGVCRCH